MRVRIYQVRAALAEKLPLVDPEARGVPFSTQPRGSCPPLLRFTILGARGAMRDARYRSLSRLFSSGLT
jgi:hypothetical protein